MRDASSGSPSSGGGSSDWESKWSSHQLTMMRGSRESKDVKGEKDEKTKDAVAYHSWWWNVAIFCYLGWDDQHLLPYVFHSLQGFSGDLARSLGEDATLTDILQTLDEHYDMVMTFDALSKGFYSLQARFQGECGQVWSAPIAAGSHTLVRVPGKDSTGVHGGDKMRSFLQGTEPQISVHVAPQSGWQRPH